MRCVTAFTSTRDLNFENGDGRRKGGKEGRGLGGGGRGEEGGGRGGGRGGGELRHNVS